MIFLELQLILYKKLRQKYLKVRKLLHLLWSGAELWRRTQQQLNVVNKVGWEAGQPVGRDRFQVGRFPLEDAPVAVTLKCRVICSGNQRPL